MCLNTFQSLFHALHMQPSCSDINLLSPGELTLYPMLTLVSERTGICTGQPLEYSEISDVELLFLFHG